MSLVGRLSNDAAWAGKFEVSKTAGQPPSPDALEPKVLEPVGLGLLEISKEQALPWFAARRTVPKMLAQLDYEHDSPMRDYVRGFALAHIGETDAARVHLQRALDSEAFDGYGDDEPIRAALARL